MVSRSNFVKAAFSGVLFSSVLTVGMGAIAAPALAQVNALDLLLERAANSETTDAIAPESAVVESKTDAQAVAESEAALLELTEALNADDVEDIVLSASVSDRTSETAADNVSESPVETVPGADALGGLEQARLAELTVATGRRDLTTASVAFAVDPAAVPALQAALHSENALTQLYAADTLWALTGDRDLVLPTLMAAAVAGDARAQEMAIRAIAQMGEQALPAVPVLNRLARDSRTRQIARDALTVVRSGNPSSAALGILARESRRRLLPAAVRAITGLWR